MPYDKRVARLVAATRSLLLAGRFSGGPWGAAGDLPSYRSVADRLRRGRSRVARNSGRPRRRTRGGIAVCCLVMALGWLRRGWPSHTQSAAFVAVSALCIAAACLIQANPFNGMFGATSFAVLGGYVAFYHTPRYLAFNFLVAAVTGVVLAYRVAEAGDTFLAFSTLVFLTVVNFATPFACQTMVHLLGINVLNADIDPLTGLLNREAFYRTAAGFIAARQLRPPHPD